jgi:hypothetical protein
MVSPVFEQGMSAHLKGRNRFLNVWMHDVANRLQIRRKALARDAGLDESYDVGTYPSETTTVVQGGPGMVKSALLTAVLMGLGGAGVLGASHLLGSLPSSRAMPADVQPPAAVVPATEFDITVETVDGKLKVTDVQEVE